MKRRKFFVAMAATWLALVGLRPGAAHADTAPRKQQQDHHLGRLIERLFTDTDSARTVGLGYLAGYPAIAADAVDRTRGLLDPPCHALDNSPGECLARQQRADFIAGRTVIIDGWVLARCEADICATLVCLAR